MHKLYAKQVRNKLSPGINSYSRGFSLFELVVFIICVAIIYAAGARRFGEFPGQAERANFLAVTIEIQTAVNLEIMLGYNTGRFSDVTAFEGANPMDLLLVPPRNYLGALAISDSSGLPRRSWYFNTQNGELVYLIEASEDVSVMRNGVSTPTDEIRFRLQVEYVNEDIRSGLPVNILNRADTEVPEDNQRRRVVGIAMLPVLPFNWEGSDPSSLIREANGDVSG